MKSKIEILNKLIDKYEKNEYKDGRHTKRPSLSLKQSSKDLPKYYKDIDYRNDIDDAIKGLVKDNLIDFKYTKNSDTIDTIYLELDHVDEVYSLLNRPRIKDEIKDYFSKISTYDNGVINAFISFLYDRKNSNKSIENYLTKDYYDALIAVYYLEMQSSQIYERNFSNKVFNDSKRFYSLKAQIKNIYNVNSDEEYQDLLIKKNIVDKPHMIAIKGSGVVHIDGNEIALDNYKNGIGLLISIDTDISFENIKKVTTIENETTYFNYSDEGLIMYLGGFANSMQIKVLNSLKDVTSSFIHFGDIDYGGYSILLDLMNKLDIKISTKNMNLDALIKNMEYTMNIDDELYIKNLSKLLEEEKLEEYHNCIRYMIEHNVWLEQESFYV